MNLKKEFIFGYQSVREIMVSQPHKIQCCYFQSSRGDQRFQELQQQAESAKLEIRFLTRKELDALLGTDNHQGFAIECLTIQAQSESFLEDLLQEKPRLLLLFLDGIQDPHNLGACIRSANAMGVDAVVAPKNRACGFTEVVHKAACGATATTPFVQVTNLARTLRQTKDANVELIGMDATAKQSISAITPGSKIGLVMGGEGQGLRRLTREHCDYLVKIPMRGTVQSLNVSVATAIGLYEINRITQSFSSI